MTDAMELKNDYPFTESLETIKQITSGLRESSMESINRSQFSELMGLMNIDRGEIERLEFSEITQLPDHEKRLHIPLRGLNVDITGTPFSGKSLCANMFISQNPDFEFYDEHHHKFIDKELRKKFMVSEEMPLYLRNYLLALLKVTNADINLEHDFLKDLFISESGWDPYTDRINMRGLNDLYSICRYLDKEFRRSFENRSYLEDHENREVMNEAIDFFESLDTRRRIKKFMERSFHLLSQYDLVALYYIDLDTAVQRRVAAGLEPYGRIVNPNYWPIVEESYKWWLHFMYPFLREHYGTGLIVIDGNNDRRRNYTRFAEFMNAAKIQKDAVRSMTHIWRNEGTMIDHIRSESSKDKSIDPLKPFS